MADRLHALDAWMVSHGVLLGAVLATMGWLYAAHRARQLARKQHTLTLTSQQLFNKDFRESWILVSAMVRSGTVPEIGGNTPEGAALQWVLNYFELVAAGVRRGDFDEQLVRDTNRGALLALWGRCEARIFALRSSRDRSTIYEHLEWPRDRWTASHRRPARSRR